MNIDVSRKPFLSKQFIGSRGRRWIATGIQYLPTLLIALLWFAKDFPARMSSDSITSWDQVINGGANPVFKLPKRFKPSPLVLIFKPLLEGDSNLLTSFSFPDFDAF
jgi:hypothetical protein